ncbi:helix-turn-helix domain-containing protein [Dehalobacterium formicoaceticum]|uniref:helix-turn-helix domain-containing protein n=2 Tax=Eubacteriales TaxID=186802 RepID=UPI0031F65947
MPLTWLWQARRDNRHGYNDTSSRPPKDLGGVSAVSATLAKGGTSGAMMPELPAAWSIPAPGTRGKCGGINIRNHGLAFAFSSWSQPILVMLMQVINKYPEVNQVEVSTHEIYRLVFKEYPDVLDVKQVSKLLGISTKTVYKLINNGTLPCLKVGREFRILKVTVMKYMRAFGIPDISKNNQ